MGGAIPSVHLCLYGVRVDSCMFLLVNSIKIVQQCFGVVNL